jgi:hypothetical protein
LGLPDSQQPSATQHQVAVGVGERAEVSGDEKGRQSQSLTPSKRRQQQQQLQPQPGELHRYHHERISQLNYLREQQQQSKKPSPRKSQSKITAKSKGRPSVARQGKGQGPRGARKKLSDITNDACVCDDVW